MAVTVSGTNIVFNDATTQTTAWTGSAGGVTSAVAGNGVAVSGATGAVTFSLGAPSGSSVGTYTAGMIDSNNTTFAIGSSIAGSSLKYATGTLGGASWSNAFASYPSLIGYLTSLGLSGTWRACTISLSTSGDDGLMNSGNLWLRIA